MFAAPERILLRRRGKSALFADPVKCRGALLTSARFVHQAYFLLRDGSGSSLPTSTRSMQKSARKAPAVRSQPRALPSLRRPKFTNTDVAAAIIAEITTVEGENRHKRPQRAHRYLRNPAALTDACKLTVRKHAGHFAMTRFYIRIMNPTPLPKRPANAGVDFRTKGAAQAACCADRSFAASLLARTVAS